MLPGTCTALRSVRVVLNATSAWFTSGLRARRLLAAAPRWEALLATTSDRDGADAEGRWALRQGTRLTTMLARDWDIGCRPHRAVMLAGMASPDLQPGVSYLGLSARRGQEAGDAIPGLQPGVSYLGLSARREQAAAPLRWDDCSACEPRPTARGIMARAFSPAGAGGGGCEPRPAAWGIMSRAFSPAGQEAAPLRWDGCSACEPRPAAWGIISRAFSPAGAWAVALTGLGWLLGMRSRAFSPGYQVTGFQPGGPGKRGMRSQACSPGYHLSGFQPGGGMRWRPYAVMAARHAIPGLQPGVSYLGLSARRGHEAARFPIEALKGRHVIT